MTVAAVLLGYALFLSVVIAPLLRRAGWVDRAPRLAIATWQAITVTVLASVVMAGLALTIPSTQVSGGLAELLQACIMALREQYSSPGGALVGLAGVALVLAVLGPAAWFLAATVLRMMRERARHRRVLDMVGRLDRGGAIVTLECEEAAVYCLPGRHRRTVITTAAWRTLDDAQLEAVLAHERAHLTERHDLILVLCFALAAAFPSLNLFRNAAHETARLVELRADDVAAARTDRLTVAGALLAITSRGTSHAIPSVALAAGGSDAAARVRRLIPPRNPLGRIQAAAGSLAVAALLVLPVLVLGGPAAATTQQDLCPTSTTSAGHVPNPASPRL